MGFMSVLYGVTVKEQGNKINITGIPQTTFMKDIKNQWGTTKLKNMFQLQFHFGRGQLMSFHKFFLPDFLYVINQLPNRRTYQLVTELIYENTYLKKLNEPIQENINLTTMQNELQFELKDYQLEFIKKYDQIKQRYSLKGYLLAFDTGLGKDQWIGCKVKVPNGWKRMGDIKVGDTVITRDGTPSNVTGVFPQGKKDMYQITFVDGRSTLCSLTHLWKVYHKNINRMHPDKPHWKVCETKEIIRLLSIKNTFTYVDLIEPEITKDAELPIDPYVLGVILGDGSIVSSSVTLTTDEEILLRVREKLPSSMILNICDYKSDTCTYCKDARIIANKDNKPELSFVKILKNLNLYGCRSWEKHIPKEYLENASFNQKLELLRGLLDTDGYVDGVKNEKCGSVRYSTSSFKLAKDIQYLVRSIGGIAKLKKKVPYYSYKNQRLQGRLSYIIYIRYKNPSELFTLERKKKRLSFTNQYSDSLRLAIKSIKYVGKLESQCIMIDHPEHLYVTDNFIVTHNTATAIALMIALGKEKIIVLTPNNVVYEFAGEINKFCKTPQKIWTKEKPISNAKWFIINYESMPKLLSLKELKSGNIGIIIDEIHYFRSANAERVKYAEMIAKYTQSVDILTMSGTPIKQAPAELIPLLKLLDPYFDEEAEQIFKKAFGVNTMQLADIVRHRLGMMMYRKTKEEVLDLPEKHEENIMVKIPNGENYTLKKVQQEVKKFVEERKKYYDQSTKQFEQDYLAGLKYFTSTSQFNKSNYNKYLNIVEAIKKKKYGSWEEKGRLMKEANLYEKTVILPTLPSELKNRFKKAKSVYKYVDMVMLGEVIGNLLTRLRAAMYSEMFKHGPIKDIIQKAIKKTIIFTTFTDVVEAAAKSARDDWGMNPSIIYGKTSKDTPAILKEFKQNPNKNPLICTMQTMATGVTVVEANTVIFVGQGFRSVDKKQAYSRVYRIGQTDDVYIYTLILDTGSEPNLSTRLEDIVSWSQQMFDAVVGDVDIDLQKVVGTESIHDDFIMDMLKFDNTSNEQTLLSSTSVVHEFLFKK